MIHIFGASYGILVATKLMMAGYDVVCVCRAEEAELLNKDGFIIKIPGYLNQPITVFSKSLPGKIFAVEPSDIKKEKISFVFLAMQEAHYSDKNIKDSLLHVSSKKIPCISIMNIPPSIYLKNLKNFGNNQVNSFYKNHEIWDSFNINYITHCSADPQVYKPYPEKNNFINVRLASNFRIADFKDLDSSKSFQQISKNVNSTRFDNGEKKIRVPINFNIFDSVYVPLGKWPMLIAGNYRCLNQAKLISIKEAVYNNLDETEKIYNDVIKLCKSLGAKNEDLICFDNYKKAAWNLDAPSSVARSAYFGLKNFERVDKLIQFLSIEHDVTIYGLSKIIENFDIKY